MTLILLLASLLGYPVYAVESIRCPDTQHGEVAEDCPWAGIARTLIEKSREGKGLTDELKALAPQLFQQIKADADRADVKDLWGRSINFDEGAKGIIVEPAILEAIASTIGAPAPEDKVVHAGMEHTYGYLFSVLKTSFGYKRARWVQGEIEKGFGLPAGILSPNTSKGTLFLNITAFTGRIAFRGDAAETRILDKNGQVIPKEIREFRYTSLKPVRLEERVEATNQNGKTRTVVLRTDLVPFLNKPSNADANSWLLIYSVVDPFHHGAQLISAFPVQESFTHRVTNPKDLGEGKSVTTRYNAFVDGISGTTLKGTRKVLEPR